MDNFGDNASDRPSGDQSGAPTPGSSGRYRRALVRIWVTTAVVAAMLVFLVLWHSTDAEQPIGVFVVSAWFAGLAATAIQTTWLPVRRGQPRLADAAISARLLAALFVLTAGLTLWNLPRVSLPWHLAFAILDLGVLWLVARDYLTLRRIVRAGEVPGLPPAAPG